MVCADIGVAGEHQLLMNAVLTEFTSPHSSQAGHFESRTLVVSDDLGSDIQSKRVRGVDLLAGNKWDWLHEGVIVNGTI